MSSAQPASRYRRRILAIGAVATGALYVIGAPFFVDAIESDLEQRVPEELATLGLEGITAEFSGQDGTLQCAAPLDDPEAARAAAFEVRGVRSIELDRTCRVNTSPSNSDDAASASADGTPESTVAATEGSDDDEDVSTDAPTTTDPQSATIREMIGANPDLAFLAVLIDEAALDDPAGPVTMFAPSNAAFDAMPAEALGLLQNDPDLLELVLRHHVADGAMSVAELPSGDLAMLSAGSVDVGRTGTAVTVDGYRLTDVDMIASDGVVHVVDGVLLPPAVELAAAAALTHVVASYDGSTVRFEGVVASEVERAVLVDAAVAVAGVGGVVDEMTVDPDNGVDAAGVATIAPMLIAMVPGLASGEVGFEAGEFVARGVAPSAEAASAFTDAARSAGVVAEVSSPPAATEDDAAELEEALNDFVGDNPIRFEPASAALTPDAAEVLDRVAADARQIAGISITIEGHTDSDGDPAVNLRLSEARAEAVLAELIARGLPETALDAVGFGSAEPVLADGVEDKAASRRVEFQVEVSG